MNWFEKLEENRKLLITGIATISIAILAVTARRNPVAKDIFWHLQTGLDWIRHGMNSWVDHYSFTHAGKAIGGQPIYFQRMAAWFVDNLGLELGLHAFKFACFASTFALVLLFLRRLRSPALIYLIVLPMLAVLIQLRGIARPELISYSFSVIAVILYHFSRGQVSAKWMLPIALLLVVWTNYHTSVLGYIVFVGLFVDAGARQLRDKANVLIWLKWLAWGGAILAVGYLNRNFSHPVLSALRFAPEWKGLIQEYGSSALYTRVPAVYVMLVIAGLTMALALVRRKFGYFVVTAVLTYYSVQMVRLVAPSGIIVLCLFASIMSKVDVSAFLRKLSRPVVGLLGTCALVMILVPLAYGVWSARAIMAENLTSGLTRPEAMVDYLESRAEGGQILNEFSVGGYLIYRLYPSFRIYIDGRTNILYPLKFYMHYLRVLNDPITMKQEVAERNIDFAILQNNPTSFVTTYDSKALQLDYVDYEYSLFVPENAQFPESGALLAYPACWEESKQSALEAEQANAIFSVPGYSMLLPYLGTVLQYGQSPDKPAFLGQFRDARPRDANITRFLAYQALFNDMDQLSLDLMVGVEGWGLGEYLAAAIANIRLQRLSNASQLMDKATTIAWANVTEGQVTLLYRTLATLEQASALIEITPDYVDQQRQNQFAMGRSPNDLEVDLDLLCN